MRRLDRDHPRLVERVTELFAEHDPALIITENPDAPRDEYSYEAERALRLLSRLGGLRPRLTTAVVVWVFVRALGWHDLSPRRVLSAGKALHALLTRPAEPASGASP